MGKKAFDCRAVQIFAVWIPVPFAAAAAEVKIAALLTFVGKCPGRRNELRFGKAVTKGA